MSGNRHWSEREDNLIRKFPDKSPEALQTLLRFFGFERTWGAVFERWQLLTGRRRREGYPNGYRPRYATHETVRAEEEKVDGH